MFRILHVLQTPRAEGTPNLVLDWLEEGQAKLWQGVLVLNKHPADLSEKLKVRADAYEEHEVLRQRWRKYPDMFAIAYRAVKRYSPDVMICWTTGFANWICVGAFAAGCRRLIVHAGNPPTRGIYGDLISRYGMWPLTAVRAKVICCSKYVRDAYRSIPMIGKENLYAVHNCCRGAMIAKRAADARLQSGPRPPTAIMVATLEAHKDHNTLLEAVPTILKSIPGFKLRLVGDGKLKHTIRSKIEQLGIAHSVEMMGTRTDVPELLGTSDLFVFSTTVQEGLGSVLIEALAAGLPVIATDVPACRELLDHGRWGKLVPPKDPMSLAHNTIDLLLSSNRSEFDFSQYALTLNARKMIQEYLAISGLGYLDQVQV